MQTEDTPAVKDRKCTVCGEEKAYTAQYWPGAHGRAMGTVCRVCMKQRKRKYDRELKQKQVAARTQALTTLAALDRAPASAKPRSITKTEAVPALASRKLEIAAALHLGSRRLNEAAGGILETILEYAMNQQSPHHEWAIKLVAERVIPKKLYEDLGAQAAGIKGGQGGVRPTVNIIIRPATLPAPGEPSGQVIVQEADGSE